MKYRSAMLVVTLALGIVLEPLAAEAEQGGKLRRIGYLSAYPRLEMEPYTIAFRQTLRELGWVEGQRVILEERFAEGALERLSALAADLVRLNVDVIVSSGTPTSVAAKQATATIPIVMIGGDPVGSGLVASLARPGGNITGLGTLAPEFSLKQLELLKEVVPHAARVAVLWNPANPIHASLLKGIQGAAPALRVRVQPLQARGPDDLDGAFSAMTRERPDALITIDDGLFLRHQDRIFDFAVTSRLPAMYYFRKYVESGGLMSYSVNLLDLYRRAAHYVHRILKGAKPADLPVEQPEKFELVINLKTAKALGLTIPPAVLLRADEIIE
jgi:putative ABC transport system substrate-binding protein